MNAGRFVTETICTKVISFVWSVFACVKNKIDSSCLFCTTALSRCLTSQSNSESFFLSKQCSNTSGNLNSFATFRKRRWYKVKFCHKTLSNNKVDNTLRLSDPEVAPPLQRSWIFAQLRFHDNLPPVGCHRDDPRVGFHGDLSWISRPQLQSDRRQVRHRQWRRHRSRLGLPPVSRRAHTEGPRVRRQAGLLFSLSSQGPFQLNALCFNAARLFSRRRSTGTLRSPSSSPPAKTSTPLSSCGTRRLARALLQCKVMRVRRCENKLARAAVQAYAENAAFCWWTLQASGCTMSSNVASVWRCTHKHIQSLKTPRESSQFLLFQYFFSPIIFLFLPTRFKN